MTIKDTQAMIAGMTPHLLPTRWVYCCTDDNALVARALPEAFALIREDEGTTLILPTQTARSLGFAADLVMRQITLSVLSDLEGVGLTAAVASSLTAANISCNVVAAFHHDHVFVPHADADRAMTALLKAQSAAQSLN